VTIKFVGFESWAIGRVNFCIKITTFIIYIAPMKALVQEVVKNFSKRLAPYGVNVRELSGDSSLTRQQICKTQMIVTTVSL